MCECDASCLSSCSYIKPQPFPLNKLQICVVYHLVPTSNHNRRSASFNSSLVVYHLVPTSNHNDALNRQMSIRLFIILFLHQTTTIRQRPCWLVSCLSSCSYIKPQQAARRRYPCPGCLSSCSYIKPQQSRSAIAPLSVVYHLVPTSNHNS